MKRYVAWVVLIGLLLPLFIIIPSTEASHSGLTDAGIVSEHTTKFILWEQLYDGSILTVDDEGNLSVHDFSNGVLSTTSSHELAISANKARLDDAQQLVAVAHQTGAYVYQLNTQSVLYNITLPDPVNDATWDAQGELWIAQFAGKRRAEEYNGQTATGIGSQTINAGISAFEILNDDRILLASYDKKIYVNDENGDSLFALTEPTSIISKMIELENGEIVAGTTTGMIYHYNTTTWDVQTLQLPNGKQVTLLEEGGDEDQLYVGTKQGELYDISLTNYSINDSFSGTGDVIGMVETFAGQIYIIGSTPTSSKVHLFDLDTDGDGINDELDAFPSDPTQSVDADGDGYGDNPTGTTPDAFPNDDSQWSDIDGDGYGDNPSGNQPDAFPTNPEQHVDTDGDGYGDNINGQDGDAFPEESTQWADTDSDNYGDNPDGYKPDACPTVNGFSKHDRYGCPDTDLDGYSNPDADWTINDGADALPQSRTQWLDGDGDGFGDNTVGERPDACPWEFGNSTRSWVVDAQSAVGYSSVPTYGCLDQDGDGWVDRTESPLMDTDPNEHFDGDGDGVGSNADYDDTRSYIQTEQDHCLSNKNDTSEACQGWNNPEYQSYLNNLDGETGLGYFAWNATLSIGASSSNSDSQTDLIMQVVKIGGIAFALLTGIILLAASVIGKRKTKIDAKTYGGVLPNDVRSSAREALEGVVTAKGGVISDGEWDDDVAEFEFEDAHAKQEAEEESESSPTQMVEMDYGNESIEAIAGMPAENTSSKTEATPQKPTDAPPLPEGGLPEGWTMDQWQWYGHEWLAKNKKN